MVSVTLSNPGERTAEVHEAEARATVERWKAELVAAGNEAVVTEIHLGGRKYWPDGASVIVDFLGQHMGSVTVCRVNDTIASLETAVAEKVLGMWGDLFCHAPLEELDVSDNAIGVTAFEKIRPLLAIPTLVKIVLNNNGLGSECIQALAHVLTEPDQDGHCIAERLTHLECYNNMAGLEGARAFSSIIERCRSLGYLRYEGCRPSPPGCAAIAQALLAMCLHSPTRTLETLLLEGSFGKDMAGSLGDLIHVLLACFNLHELRLNDAALESLGTKYVCKNLTEYSNGSLTSLELPQNEITRHTLRKRLAALIEKNLKTLKVLDLSSNELYSTGVVELVEIFHDKENVLEILKLNENFIGTRGATALMKANFPHLQSIELDENGFPDQVVLQLQVFFGDKLGRMGENCEDDCDEDDTSVHEEDEASDQEEEEAFDAVVFEDDGLDEDDEDVDDLAAALRQAQL